MRPSVLAKSSGSALLIRPFSISGIGSRHKSLRKRDSGSRTGYCMAAAWKTMDHSVHGELTGNRRSTMSTKNAVPAVVLVHGGFVDGSGWEDVYRILKKDGYDVSVVQNPTTSLEADVAATKQLVAMQTSPVILVGHSYGG